MTLMHPKISVWNTFIDSRVCCLLACGQSDTFIEENGILLLAERKRLSVMLSGLLSPGLGAEGSRRKSERERIHCSLKQISALSLYTDFSVRNNKSSPAKDVKLEMCQLEKWWFPKSTAPESQLRWSESSRSPGHAPHQWSREFWGWSQAVVSVFYKLPWWFQHVGTSVFKCSSVSRTLSIIAFCNQIQTVYENEQCKNIIRRSGLLISSQIIKFLISAKFWWCEGWF